MEGNDEITRWPINQALIRRLREEEGLSIEAAAEGMKISAKTLAMFEKGGYDSVGQADRINRKRNLGKIAKFYGLPGWEALIVRPDGVEPVNDSGSTSKTLQRLEPEPSSRSVDFHVLYDPMTYGHRFRVENQARERLRRSGVPLVIQAPEGFGKKTFVSWLLDEGVQKLPSHRAVRIRLSTFSESVLSSLSTILDAIAERILHGIQHESPATLLAAARTRPGSEVERFRWLLGQHVLSADRLLILVFERVDRLWGSPVQDDFFALLRVMTEENDGSFEKLRLVVTVATEPTLLDTIDHSGFFVSTKPIELLEFDDDEVRHLAERHGHTLQQSELKLLRLWLGGQPALLRLAFYQAAQEHLSLQSLFEQHSLRIATFRAHLLRLHRWLARHPQLSDALSAVLNNSEWCLSPEDYGLLYSKALLREYDGGLRLSCQLYADYLLPLLKSVGEVAHAGGR